MMVQHTPRPVVIVTCEYAPFPGGIGTYSVELAIALAGHGHRVIVVAPAYDGDAALPEGIEHHRILRHHSIPFAAAPRLLAILSGLPRDAIILAADIRTLLLLRVLQPVHRRRYRVMVHGSEASKFKRGSAMFALARNAYLAADLVAYNSQATGDIFRAQLGRPVRDAVTYLGVGGEWLSAPAPGDFESDALASLPAAPLFCSIGRLEPRKGHLDTVRALARARDVHGMTDPVYVVVGRAEDPGYGESIIEAGIAYGIRTILPGRLSVDDIKRVYARATANLLFARALPGKIEGFGLVLVEAAAQGCPSIGAAIGGIPEVLGDTGALVDSDDLDGFAGHIARFAGDAQLRAAQGAAARARAERFNWDGCARATFPELFADIEA